MGTVQEPPRVTRLPLRTRVRQLGVAGTAHAVRGRLVPYRIPDHARVIAHFSGRGLEIGGPSSVFGKRGLLPLYPLVDGLDNVNFAAATIWEGTLVDGATGDCWAITE